MTPKIYVSPANCELCVPIITTAPDTGITNSAHERACPNHPHRQERSTMDNIIQLPTRHKAEPAAFSNKQPPPPGFRTVIFRECWDDGEGCEDEQRCPHDEQTIFMGPSCAKDTWTVTTQWTPERGIFFMIGHDEPELWTLEETSELSAAITAIQHKLNPDAA